MADKVLPFNGSSESKIIEDLYTISTSSGVRQLGNKQDFAISGINLLKKQFIVTCDGHGKRPDGRNLIVELLQILDWITIASQKNPIGLVQEKIAELGSTICQGSTISIAIIHEDHIRIQWLGDSTIKIYFDGTKIFQSKNHEISGDELDHALSYRDGITLKPFTGNDYSLAVFDDNKVTMKRSPVLNLGPGFKTADCLNMSRSLGHADEHGPRTQQESDNAIIPITTGGNYKVVIATDGLWDMVSERDDIFLGNPETTVKQILDFAEGRWKQDWEYYDLDAEQMGGHTDKFEVTKFPEDNYDDIGVAIADIIIH